MPATPLDPRREAVFEALGAASACWSNLEGAGVFDAERAGRIGDDLLERLDAITREAGDPVLEAIRELRTEEATGA